MLWCISKWFLFLSSFGNTKGFLPDIHCEIPGRDSVGKTHKSVRVPMTEPFRNL
jgi:hypothetical protein